MTSNIYSHCAAALNMLVFTVTISDFDNRRCICDCGLHEPFLITGPASLKGKRGESPIKRQSPFSKLPQELVDEIVDYLQPDKASLKACALAAQIFLPRCRKHLFHSLTVRKYGRDPYKLQFVPNVARHIREITIQGNLCSEVQYCSRFLDCDSIESLHLEGSMTDWAEIQWIVSRSQLPNFPNLKRLSLHRVYFSSCGEMVSTLRSFRSLKSLSIEFEDWKYSTYSMMTSLSQANREFHLPLRTLHMRLNMVTPLGPVPQTLLSSTGDVLQHLSLDIISATAVKPALAIMSEIDLSRNVSLESLTLRFCWFIYRPPWITFHDDLPLMGLLLSRIHSPYFRSVTFRIDFRRPEVAQCGHQRWANSLDLRFLDRLAGPGNNDSLTREELERARATARNLEEVKLVLEFPWPVALQTSLNVQKSLRAQMPKLNSKGILHIIDAAYYDSSSDSPL